MDRPLEIRAVEICVAFAALVVVPVALPLVERAHRDGRRSAHLTGVRRLTWVAAPAFAAAMLLRPHPLAGALAVPWMIVAALLAAYGVRRFLERSRKRVEETIVDLGLLYLPVGAAWGWVAASGGVLLGFSGSQALLTAAHFHYAGFGACVVVGALGRALGARWRVTYTLVAVTHAASVALVAIGITVSRTLEAAASFVLAIAFVVTGIVLLLPARRAIHGVAGVLLAIAGTTTFCSGALAFHFALEGFDVLDEGRLARMVWLHGVLNTFGFVFASLVAFRLARPRSLAQRSGTVFSRLRARGGVFADFFVRSGAVDPGRAAHGLMDSFDDFRGDDFDPTRVSPAIKHFYEHTDAYRLDVVPTWQRGFVLGGRLFHALARRVGQLRLPVDDTRVRPIESRIVALKEGVDGRPAPRGWVRTYADGAREVIYVAAYANHTEGGRRWMNIAFPLPLCNMTSLLRLAHREGGGIAITTLPARSDASQDQEDGDGGVYIASRFGHARLPLDETIDVWDEADGTLRATHDMWLFGVHYLHLAYRMERIA